jgi:1-aminocyclopropane-1-carboxylate deaminase
MLRSRSITLATTLLIQSSSSFPLLPGIVAYHRPSQRLLRFSSTKQFVEDESFDDILRDVLYPSYNNNKDSKYRDPSSCSPPENESSLLNGQKAFESKNGWRTIDWWAAAAAITSTNEIDHAKSRIHQAPAPVSHVETIMVRDRIVHIKRDDQLRLRGSQISGNKARKMWALNQIPVDLFPQCIVSYGGPQSNAMLAIAAVVRYKKDTIANNNNSNKTNDRPLPRPVRFVYYTRTLPRFLKRQPTGNLYRALSLGMELIQVSSQEYHYLFGSDWGGSDDPPVTLDPPVFGDSVWIPQGGACAMAAIGLVNLANEICDFWLAKKGRNNVVLPMTVVLPGGTGATALLLHRAIEMRKQQQPAMDIQVAVVPCVGDVEYAERQMTNLNRILNGTTSTKKDMPAIIPPSPEPGPAAYFTFGEPDSDVLATYKEMEKLHDLTLDLLYGAPTWTILFRHWSPTPFDSSSNSILQNRQLLYVHTGGLEGIGTQLLRYKYKGLVAADEVQLPLKVSETTGVDQLLKARGGDT